MDEEFEIIDDNKSEIVKNNDIDLSFLDKSFIDNEIKFKLFNDCISNIKSSVINSQTLSLKASVLYVMYKLINHEVILTNDDLNNEFNKYTNHINNNFYQYSQMLGKYTLSHKFFKFSNNYLLENYYEQIYKIQEIQSEI